MRDRTVAVLVALGVLALALTGCASTAVQREIDRRKTVRQQEEEANVVAGQRTRQWCQEHPQGCDLRLVAIAHEDHTEWDKLRVPPYSVFNPIIEEELRKRIRINLADEYNWRITTTLYLLLEQGLLTEEQFKPLMEEHLRQIRASHQQYDALLRQRLAEANAEDIASFASIVESLAIGLNAYAASLPQSRITPRPAPTWTPPASIRLPPSVSTVRCTYRLWALAGMMLCVNSDGSVVAR